MKKFLSLFWVFILSVSVVFAKDMRFVQVTDIKFSGENVQMLEDFIEQINRQKDIEFVIFNGDNIAKPDKIELEKFLGKIKKLNKPFYIVLGEKDVNKHKHLSKEDYLKTIKKQYRKYKPENSNYVFEQDKFIFIVVDGSKEVIPSTNGYYKEDTLSWLENQLNLYPDKNIIIFQHFPLIPPAEKETYYTFKPEKYLEILTKHNNVKAVISGHFGVNKEITVNGINHISTAGFPYYRVVDILDYETKNPVIWAELKEIK